MTFVPMPAVDADEGVIVSPQERPFLKVRGGYTPFQNEDVIFAKITPCMENGKAAVVRGLVNGLGFGSSEFHVMRSFGAVLPDFLCHYIRQETFRKAAEAEMTGSVGQKRMPADFVKRALLPLPPLAEQKRMVAAVERLFEQLSGVRERLEKVPDLLKRFRQSVLAAACSGRLTEDCREHSKAGRGVEGLLQPLRNDRLRNAETAKQRDAVNRVYETVEENDSEDLPEGWAYVTLAKVALSFDYGSAAKSAQDGKVPVLRMGNIQEGKVVWDDLVYTSDEEEIAKYRLDPRTVLFNRTNSPELVGKTGIYLGERPAVFAGYLIRINHSCLLDPRYLNCCLNTTYAREFCNHVKTDGVSQSNINATKLSQFEVPLCPLEEQHEIVRRVEALFRLADDIEARVAAATARAEKLQQAILAKAFRGELVPTEAALARQEGREYEPASKLLERIKAEREQHVAPPDKPRIARTRLARRPRRL